jgi:transcriptional regulator with XRE-family HTH domain
MIKTNILKARFVEKGYTQQDIARELGITGVTLSRKLNRGVFNSDEIYKMIVLLDIKDPAEIFFAE